MFADKKAEDAIVDEAFRKLGEEMGAVTVTSADPFVHPCSMTLPQLQKLINQYVRMKYDGATHTCLIEQVAVENGEISITCLRFPSPGSRDKVNVSQGMVLVSREPVKDLFAEIFRSAPVKTEASL